MVTNERIRELMSLAEQEGILDVNEYLFKKLSLIEFHESKIRLYSSELKYKKPSGDLINVQKAILNELDIIIRLKKLEEDDDKDNKEDKFPIPIKQIEEVDIKKPNKYVYAYTDLTSNNKVKLIYFGCHLNENIINILEIRNFNSIEDASDAIFVAKSLGYRPILNKIALSHLLSDCLGENRSEYIYCNPTVELYSEAYMEFANIGTVILKQINEAKLALDSFDKECLDISNGLVKYVPKVEDDNSSLLKELMLAIHLIKEDNK